MDDTRLYAGEAVEEKSYKMEENKARKRFEKMVEAVFLFCAFMAVLSVAVITFFVFARGGPFILEYGIGKFILGRQWQPLGDVFGILPMIIASIAGTLGAILVGVPIGIMTAVFLSEIAPAKIADITRPAVDLLAGIPSVVYGFFGLVVIVPLIDKWFGGGGNSLLAIIIILAVMILPTVVSISEAALRAVPRKYRAHTGIDTRQGKDNDGKHSYRNGIRIWHAPGCALCDGSRTVYIHNGA